MKNIELLKDSFKLSDDTLKKLKADRLSDKILEELKSLREREFISQDELLDVVKDKIGEEEFSANRDLILNCIHQEKKINPNMLGKEAKLIARTFIWREPEYRTAYFTQKDYTKFLKLFPEVENVLKNFSEQKGNLVCIKVDSISGNLKDKLEKQKNSKKNAYSEIIFKSLRPTKEMFFSDMRLTSAQLRKFYGEVKRIEALVEQKEYEDVEHLIYMLKAKAAYAANKNSKKIPDDFRDFLSNCVDSITNEKKEYRKKAFKAFCLYFEAIVGYFYGEGVEK